MTITIPSWLVSSLFYTASGSLVLTLMAFIWFFTWKWTVTALKNRNLLGVVRVWLTTDKLRQGAMDENWYAVENCMTKLREHDPKSFEYLMTRQARPVIDTNPQWLADLTEEYKPDEKLKAHFKF